MNLTSTLEPCTRFAGSIILPAATALFAVSLSCQAAAGTGHACDYLTVGEVGSALGFEVSHPERQPPNPLGQSICFFDAPQEQGIRFAQLQLVSSSSEDLKGKGFTPASLFASVTAYMDNPMPVDGVGEKALWGGSGIQVGAGLHVYYKDVYFVVLAKTANDEDSLTKSKVLAEIVVSKVK